MFAGWDGSFGGEPCQDGIYIWTIAHQNPNNAEIFRRQGHVTLLR